MHRPLLALTLIFATTLSASAQTAQPPAAGWARVQALAAGTEVHVFAGHHQGGICEVKSVDADSLRCSDARVIPRGDIRSIKLPHRAASAVVAGALGLVAGNVIGLEASKHCGTLGCLVALALVDIAVVVGSVFAGLLSDFLGKTIYQKP